MPCCHAFFSVLLPDSFPHPNSLLSTLVVEPNNISNWYQNRGFTLQEVATPNTATAILATKIRIRARSSESNITRRSHSRTIAATNSIAQSVYSPHQQAHRRKKKGKDSRRCQEISMTQSQRKFPNIGIRSKAKDEIAALVIPLLGLQLEPLRTTARCFLSVDCVICNCEVEK